MVRVKKVRHKKWFKILAPVYFGKVEVGEALAAEPGELVGRTVEVTLGDLTNDLSKQHVKLKLKVKEANGENVVTDVCHFEISLPYIARLVRKRVSLIDEVYDIESKDARKMRVKFLVVTLRRVHSRQATAIRKTIEKIVKKEIPSKEFKDFILDVCNYKFQEKVLQEVRKICPVRNLEVRKVEVLN